MPSATTSDDSIPLIVHVIYRLQVGGLENGVVNLVNQLPADQFRHAIVCLSESTDFRDRLQRADVAVYEMHKRPGQDFGLWRRLFSLFREIRPTLVHTRNIGCLEAQLPALACGVPCRIHGEHGWDISDPDGSNGKYRWFRRGLSPLVHTFIALSRELEGYLLHRVGIRQQKIERIYNGVDNVHFHPGHSAVLPANFKEPDSIVFGTVGRMHGVKDQGNLCRAFIRLCEQRPVLRPRLRLALIGDGPLHETCRAMLDTAGLLEQSWLPGARSDIPNLLRALDVFVLPSQAEGISNTILEAMACGLPIIATDVGGNPELVDQARTGFLVPPDNPAALAERMAQYADNPALRQLHGTAGIERVGEHFSMDRMLSAYGGLYNRLIAQQRKAK